MIRLQDVMVETFSGSPDSERMVKLTHLPTGIRVQCDETVSRWKNKQKAWELLEWKVYEHQKTEEKS
jgi:protein subunit release factor A